MKRLPFIIRFWNTVLLKLFLWKYKQALWSLRENITQATKQDGYVYKYDVSLPLEVFYQIIIDLKEHLQEFSDLKRICGFGHLGKLWFSVRSHSKFFRLTLITLVSGDGNIHVNITSAEFSETLIKAIEPFIFEKVSQFRGSISAEHGIGFMKTKYLKFSKNNNEIILMKNLKTLMDPNGILNPYKVLNDWITYLF